MTWFLYHSFTKHFSVYLLTPLELVSWRMCQESHEVGTIVVNVMTKDSILRSTKSWLKGMSPSCVRHQVLLVFSKNLLCKAERTIIND